MSVFHYKDEWDRAKTRADKHVSSLAGLLVTPISSAIAAGQYATLTDSAFSKQLSAVPSLYYFKAQGVSEINAQHFEVTYLKSQGPPWRSTFPEGYIEQLDIKLLQLKRRLESDPSEVSRITFLLNRLSASRQLYQQVQEKTAFSKSHMAYLNYKNVDGLDAGNWLYTLNLPSTNLNGGKITFIFDLSELKSIRERILVSAFEEILLAMFVAVLLLTLTIYWLFKPLEELTQFVSNHIDDIEPNELPGLKRDDEIGELSRKFKTVLHDAHIHVRETNRLALTDPLTGLFNRRHYNQIVQGEIYQVTRSSEVLSFFYIDIDRFKSYNDTYGHAQGDTALKQVALALAAVVRRENDFCFRFGGEEFLVICRTQTEKDALLLARGIRNTILSMQLPHENSDPLKVLTVSIGICTVRPGYQPSEDEMLQTADQALYEAKATGRNRVIQRLLRNEMELQSS